MKVVPVPCLRDNYAYLVICPRSGEAAIVDPGEAGPVEDAVAEHGVSLRAIWCTHHHADHVGGAAALLARFGKLEVVAHARDRERIDAANRLVEDGDVVTLGTLRAAIIHNPGHTAGAISYWVAPEKGPPAVFTGDTLFGGGCGRLFEGTAEQMYASLSRLAALDPETRVYFGHEYTAANLRFAEAVEPENSAIVQRRQELATGPAAIWPARPSEGVIVTTPSTIGEERATNPFLRTAEPMIIQAAKKREPDRDSSSASSVFAIVRGWKDRFG
jgi:hydroxyacylglutathione hydrolase